MASVDDRADRLTRLHAGLWEIDRCYVEERNARLAAEAAFATLRADVVDLCALALFHAQHVGVSEDDRKRMLDLAVSISEAMKR